MTLVSKGQWILPWYELTLPQILLKNRRSSDQSVSLRISSGLSLELISRISETTLVLAQAGWILQILFSRNDWWWAVLCYLADLSWWKNGFAHNRKYPIVVGHCPSVTHHFLQALNAINLVWAFSFSSLKATEPFTLEMDRYIHVNFPVLCNLFLNINLKLFFFSLD